MGQCAAALGADFMGDRADVVLKVAEMGTGLEIVTPTTSHLALK